MRRAGLIGGGISLVVVLVLASRELVERAPRERGRTAATKRGADGPEDDRSQGLVAPASVTDETRGRSERALRIWVRDETGEPVRGARVSVVDSPRNEATTDGSGLCDLAPASGELELEVSAPGHVAFRDRFFGTREELELVLPRCGHMLGRVVDETSGAPIAGARVHVRRESRWHPEVADVLADSEGRFRFDCAPLTGAFCASAPGFPEGEGESDPDDEDEVTIALTPAVTIEVEVREAPNGPPIEAARVRGAVLAKLNACTDAEGRVFVAKEECDTLLEIQALDFCAVTGNLRDAELPSSGPLVFFLWRPAYLAGVVRDASGRPVEGVQIDFEGDHGSDRWGLLPQLPAGCQYALPRGGVVRLQNIEVRSDAAGRYRSVPLFPGSSEVRVHAAHPTGDCFTTAPAGRGGHGHAVRPDDHARSGRHRRGPRHVQSLRDGRGRLERSAAQRLRAAEDGGETDSTVLLRIQPATIDLWVEADGGYLPVLLESLVAELGTAPRLDVRLARGLEVALEIDGDFAALASEALFLLESDVWQDVRAGGGEHAQNPVWVRDGDGNLAVDAGPRLSAHELELRRISVRDGRRTSVSGLRPGSARFKSLSGHVRFEPETVTLPCPQPLRVRCTRVE